jgi:hypothetical protein
VTPTAALAALANCASAAVTPAITTLVVGPRGVGDEVPCCGGGSIVVELDAIRSDLSYEDRGALDIECPSSDTVVANVAVSRCVETVRSSKGYSGGGAPTTATFNSEGSVLIADAEALYVALKCCISTMFDNGDIADGKVEEARMTRNAGCATVLARVSLTVALPCPTNP